MRIPGGLPSLAVTVLLAAAGTSCTDSSGSPGPPPVTVHPIRYADPPQAAPRHDGAVLNLLQAHGLMRADVETVGHVALRDGYLTNASYNQAETFALAAAETCQHVRRGNGWQAEVDRAVAAGAPRSQAADMVRYLRVGFCPLVKYAGRQ